jgi:hypothetical protein
MKKTIRRAMIRLKLKEERAPRELHIPLPYVSAESKEYIELIYTMDRFYFIDKIESRTIRYNLRKKEDGDFGGKTLGKRSKINQKRII